MVWDQIAELIKGHREAGLLASLPVSHEDTIVIVGAYKGDTLDYLDALYTPQRIVAFEPQEWAVLEMASRFEKRRNRIIIVNHALGTQSGEFEMGEYGNDACSFKFDPAVARTKFPGIMMEYTEALNKYDIDRIKLMVMNIEGYEDDLIPHIIENDLIGNIEFLLVQFHTAQYEMLREYIKETHRVYWDWGPSWVCFQRYD